MADSGRSPLLDVRFTEGLGLACESTDLALMLTCSAACATSAPVLTALRETTPVFVFVFASCVAARLIEFGDSERFMLRLDEGAASEHTRLLGLCMFSEPNRWCAGRRRTDSPSRCCKRPMHDKPVRRPPTDGRPVRMQRMCRLTSRCSELPPTAALR